jgi:Protein of unknown function (DUF2937)
MRAHPVAFVMGLLIGFVLSQAPEFAQQYRQRLGGAVDELARIIQQFDQDSRRSGYDRTAALRLMARNGEQLIRDQAGRMEETIARHDRLRAQETAFRNGGSFVRISAFILNFDRPLVQGTIAAYEPAVPVTTEGLLLAGGGFLAAYLLLPAFGEFRRRRRALRAKLRDSMVKQS